MRLNFDVFQLEHDYESCCGDYVEVRERKESYRFQRHIYSKGRKM